MKGMNLRRDLELWNFNIVVIAVDYGGFGSWTKCTLPYAMCRHGLHKLMCLNRSMGVRGWNVMVCICSSQGVALLEVVSLLE